MTVESTPKSTTPIWGEDDPLDRVARAAAGEPIPEQYLRALENPAQTPPARHNPLPKNQDNGENL